MSYNVKNYTEQGGEKTVIGGTLEIKSGASVTGITTATIVDNLTSTDADKALSAKQGKALKDAADLKVAANQADSTATEVAGLVTDFNALLAKLKAAGIMVADA
jgi:hypothetical protein